MQNMLLVALDHMELSHAARIVCINITAVQTGSLWLPETGDIGSAAVSLLSISENFDVQLSEVVACRTFKIKFQPGEARLTA